MNFLFIHQNFPGQFRHVAWALAQDPAHQVVAMGEDGNLRKLPPLHARIQTLAYPAPPAVQAQTHPYLRDFERHVRRGQQVARLCLALRERGFRPDVVLVHPGWGEGLFVRDVFPEARHIHYLEYFYQGRGGDIDFDPEFPQTLDDQARVRIKNSTQLPGLVDCDVGVSPTQWQCSRYPPMVRANIKVLHEGIDTDAIAPNASATFESQGLRFRAGDEVVTYVARNLEPYRGFHVLMRSLPEIQRRCPRAHTVIVGGDDVSYGSRPTQAATYRELYRRELGDTVDWDRVHFTGRIPYRDFLSLMQVSACHVYLTYPFVLSWSMLEALSAGALVVASDTEPVREVVEHGVNGWLVNFHDTQALADRVADVLRNPAACTAIRRAARDTVRQRFDLRRICLPQWLQLLTSVSPSQTREAPTEVP
ncbi:MAG: glycosyltransferase [Betaproteobacteria bacterium]|nr:glycosyltransferase [Betaproteobacteria bacterium]